VLKSHLCVLILHSACINHTRTCRNHTCKCQNYTLRVKLHSAGVNCTLHVESTPVRVEITPVRVEITPVRFEITHVRVLIADLLFLLSWGGGNYPLPHGSALVFEAPGRVQKFNLVSGKFIHSLFKALLQRNTDIFLFLHFQNQTL
jgi:hypothetical protein